MWTVAGLPTCSQAELGSHTGMSFHGLRPRAGQRDHDWPEAAGAAGAGRAPQPEPRVPGCPRHRLRAGGRPGSSLVMSTSQQHPRSPAPHLKSPLHRASAGSFPRGCWGFRAMTAPLLTSAQVAPRGNRSDGPAGSGPVGRAASRGPSWPWRCGCGPWCQRPPTGLSTQTGETRIANPPRPDDASCSAPRGAQCGEVGTKVPGRLGARGHGSGDHTEAPRHAMSPELGDPPPSDQRADLCSPRMCVDVRAFALGWRPRAPCDGNDGDMCPGHSPAGCVTVTPPTGGGAFRSVLVTVTPPTGGGAFRSVLVLILGPRCSPLSQFQGPGISKQGVVP